MRILVVEDDYFLADRLTHEIREMGDCVVGPFPDVQAAIRHAEGADAAILDVKLGEQTSFGLADALTDRGIPFLFFTGFDPQIVPPRFRGRPIYNKPSHVQPLLDALRVQQRLRPVPPPPSIESIVQELLAQARRLMPDRLAAERLVEAALKSAIQKTERGEAEAELRLWLRRLLDQEYQQHSRRHLH